MRNHFECRFELTRRAHIDGQEQLRLHGPGERLDMRPRLVVEIGNRNLRPESWKALAHPHAIEL
jgi:hypothetical protein